MKLKWSKYIPCIPTVKQQLFLMLDDIPEILYGGAAGGGKSQALLMAALQYVDVPGYNAIIFRKTFTDLAQPGALMDRAREWLQSTDAKWNEHSKTWTFPSGATLSFGYMKAPNDKYKYQSAEYHYIAFDELTQFQEAEYLYMFSRLRKTKSIDVPLRMRAATNPGGIGHEWVKQRFIDTDAYPQRMFIPAGINDNPHLDAEQYKQALLHLDPVTRERLLHGNWTIEPSSDLFNIAWVKTISPHKFQQHIISSAQGAAIGVRAWDLAATTTGDWTVGALVIKSSVDGKLYVADIARFRLPPGERDEAILQTAKRDTQSYPFQIIQLFEQQPGEAGVTQAQFIRKMLSGTAIVEFTRPTASKIVRSTPMRSAMQNGGVVFVHGQWMGDLIKEMLTWTGGKHDTDDQIDALSMACNRLLPKASIDFNNIAMFEERTSAIATTNTRLSSEITTKAFRKKYLL